MEDAYIIQGGRPLKGEVQLSGAKNVALKTIIGALLFESKVILENIPQINDVLELIHLLRELGVHAEFTSKNTLQIDPTTLSQNKVELLHASKTRVSFMLFAPLLHHFSDASAGHPGGDVFIPNPGGCRIGARPIDRIIEGMRALGASIDYNTKTGYYEARLNKDISGTYKFQKTSHTGTELLIMLAVFGRGTITLENAAPEPEIDDLITFLNEGGAKIERKGRKVYIHGVKKLVQEKPYRIMNDRNEAVTYAVLAITTGGDIMVNGIKKEHLTAFLDALTKTNAGIEYGEEFIRFYSQGKLSPVNIETAVEPGFMTDWQPNWAVLMTQAEGESIVHERVFESRFSYVGELKKLGADIDFIDIPVPEPELFYEFNFKKGVKYQQAIRIKGPQKLHNGVLTVGDLRAGATLAIAALTADKESVINGVSILERGYEDFVGKIRRLGGKIKKV